MAEQTAIQKRNEELAVALNAKKKTAYDLLVSLKGSISAVLPKHLTPERMTMIAYTAMQRTPKLLETTRESIIGSIMTASMLGLEPSGPLGHGALIPYWNGRAKCFECQFQPMYQGLLELGRRSGFILSVQLRSVRVGDKYSYRYGLRPDLIHEPLQGEGADDPDRKVTNIYCVIDLIGGGQQWDQMSWEEGIAHGRRFSPSWDFEKNAFKPDSAWATDTEAMISKTVLKKVLKLCPKSPEMAAALLGDDGAERGRTVKMVKTPEGVFDVDFGPNPDDDPDKPPTGRETGKVNVDQLKPGSEENRGHDDTKLDQAGKDTPKAETKPKVETLEQKRKRLAAEKDAAAKAAAAVPPPAETKPEGPKVPGPEDKLTDDQFAEIENAMFDGKVDGSVWIVWARKTFDIRRVSDMRQKHLPIALAWLNAGGKDPE